MDWKGSGNMNNEYDNYENETAEQGFYAVIPSDVLNDINLRPNAKILYAYISSYTKRSGVCFASNNTLATAMGITAQGVSNLVKMLQDQGYISIEYVRKGKQIVRRNITLGVSTNVGGVSTNVIEPINKRYRTYQQITKESIKVSEKENIKKENKAKSGKPASDSPFYSDALFIAQELERLHKEFVPSYEGNPKRWAKDIELLLRKKDKDEVMAVLRWAKNPKCFWFPNIMSGSSFKREYDRLLAQMLSEKEKNRPKTDEELLREMGLERLI